MFRRGSWADRKREMYAGGRPNDEAKAVHRRFAAGPLPRLLPIAAVIETRGRQSGATIRVPLVTVPYRGRWYVVSMLGEQTNWVKNVRAAEGKVVMMHGRRRCVRLDEVPVEERGPIIKRYLLFAIGARPHVPISWRAPVAAFDRLAAEYPVFRVVSVTS